VQKQGFIRAVLGS